MSTMMDSARTHTAASYVNGLVNCGFGKEKMIQEEGKDGSWLSRQKDLGKFMQSYLELALFCTTFRFCVDL